MSEVSDAKAAEERLAAIEEANRIAAIEALSRIEKQLEDLSDGTVQVSLRRPLKLSEGTVRSSLVVRVAKVRDIRAAARSTDANGDVGINELADQIVEPNEAHLDITDNEDWQAVRLATERQLGKFLGTGDAS